jgi:hypothetical protein
MLYRFSATRRVAVIWLVSLCVASCGPTAEAPEASERSNQPTGGDRVIEELLRNLSGVEQNILALADEFEQVEYDWRPAEGVRSGADVLMHVTTINYAFPLFAGHEAPASTGLTMENLPEAAPDFESSLQAKDDVLPELRSSFEHLRSSIESTSGSDLERQITVFGQAITVRGFWIGHVGHLHEHLGQLIAYGRTNSVVPPWSR